jgi:iron complex transport system substrate-binding protein
MLFTLIAVLLAGCGGEGTVTPIETLTLIDARGREVTLTETPQRIVVAGRANFMINDAVYAFLEAPERVAALTQGNQERIATFTALLDPAYEEKARFTHEAGAEEIAATEPDVVLLKGFMAETLGEPLERLNIPVVYLDLETPAQYQRDLAILGRIFDNPDRAQALWQFYQDRMATVEESLAGLSEAERPRVLVLQHSAQGGEVALKVPPAGWIQTEMVTLAGGAPVWTEAAQGGGWQVVNLEQISAWDPDQIFVIDYFGDVDETVAQLAADPKWQTLTAVENDHLYAFPKDFYSWDQPDTRWYLGLTWLATRVQPERFQVDVGEEVYAFYDTLYSMDRATVDEHIVPQLQGDVAR